LEVHQLQCYRWERLGSDFVFGGYFFGNIPFVKRNFTMIIFAIIIISVLPGVIEFIRRKHQQKKEKLTFVPRR